MATYALLSVLIFGISLVLKCEFSSAHAQAEPDIRSHAVILLYQIIGDLYEVQNENKLMAEKIEMLEGKLETSTEETNKGHSEKFESLERKLESLETSAEGKLIGQNEKFEILSH